ncbi:MAG: orotidine-5'-phosphate decarboxylase [Bdellovibrionaceae bacterium]|nr:orotidine-5'-phosphate decarboxylase [Pseudobdellovibrionaceae bacterium]|tara:strand:- start:106142 stop:106825 length:684 start_codon:yes stop_codon:yes gene_type:complete
MKEVIVALDYPEANPALKLIDQIGEDLTWVKVGMQLYYKEGPKFIDQLKSKKLKIFLDLKLHDIPHTVARACESLLNLGVDMTNVHCLGGKEMMAAAAEVCSDQLQLIGVTQLTSTSQRQMNQEMSIPGELEQSVLSLASLAKESALSGVVCSSFEAALIKKHCGSEFLSVCPGIRFEEDAKDDQVRVASPKFAGENSVDFAVIGRSITKANSPKDKFLQAIAEMRI